MKSLKKHMGSYKFAFRGILCAFRHENNMRFHLGAAVMVLLMNFVLEVGKVDWLITVILIGLAWMAEIFNTAIEKLADRVTPEFDAPIGQVKDLSSAAVMVICSIALICAVFIYFPYLSDFILQP